MKCNTKDADNILIGAIAKKNNELFLPGKSEPFLLKDMPQPVSNLILHIRDEAHRFAISYHRLLRKKAILKNT
jgi:excinuclease ABC subunit C